VHVIVQGTELDHQHFATQDSIVTARKVKRRQRGSSNSSTLPSTTTRKGAKHSRANHAMFVHRGPYKRMMPTMHVVDAEDRSNSKTHVHNGEKCTSHYWLVVRLLL
jgi:hypothetical protein